MIRGGIADKLGNGYEALWTLSEALRVLSGRADDIRIEPFNEDATGLEFRVTERGRKSWHQCKSRLRSGSWRISTLDSAGVLADFARKLRDPTNTCVFVSSDPAPALETLTGKATIVDSVKAFRDSLGEEDQLDLQALARAWPVDLETLFDWLRRVRVETVSETSLERELTGLCELLFTVSPDRAIERLATFLDEKVTYVITTEVFRAAVDSLGLGWQARFDSTLKEKLDAATNSYLASLAPPIAGVEIDTPDLSDTVVVALKGPGRVTVVSGPAGSGKSLALRRAVAAARQHGWSVLGFRIDWFLDARALGDIGVSLVGREENPVAVLGNHASNSDCLLVIDQVDAVSEASGRSGRIRELVFQMIHAARYYPGLRVVLACRTYDLDNDSRLKALEKEAKAASVRMKPLDWATAVQPVLERLGLKARRFSDQQRKILSVAINLQIFATLSLAGEVPEGDLTGAQLFDKLLELRAREMLRDGIAWTPYTPLAQLANWMSENQVLAAPAHVIAAFPRADALNSYGLVNKAAGKIQFAHESFFDHVFSADFVNRGGSVLVLLKSDQQRLFRRTQVRQIFARLRDQGGPTYLSNLREVMESAEVRYLVKDAVATWLASVEAPLQAELELVEGWWERGHFYERLARMVVNGGGWLPALIHSGAVAQWIGSGGSMSDMAFWLLRKGAVAHASVVAAYLRDWWRGDAVRTSSLRAWFNRLHPDGPIGELEELYRDVIAAVPASEVTAQFEANFELATWVHRNGDRSLGARVLGWWLTRWMEAFADSHPFGRDDSGGTRYWIKELADDAPLPFLDATFPAFVEGIRRERLALKTERLDYPAIRLTLNHGDEWILLVDEALRQAAVEAPARVEEYLDALPPEGAPALWLHLRAIAANGIALYRRLLALLDNPDLFKLGEQGSEWRPFAEAAHTVFPFLSEEERSAVESRVLRHRPEYEGAREVLRWARDENRALDPVELAYARQLIHKTGEVERAILLTIGEDQLGQVARRRVSELERKFPSQPLPEASGIRGGFVRSPISDKKATLMNDAQWLGAIQRYAGGERHVYDRDGVVGGPSSWRTYCGQRQRSSPSGSFVCWSGCPVARMSSIPQRF